MRIESARRASGPRSLSLIAAAGVVIAAAVAGGRARADVVTELAPSVGAGATDNVNVTTSGQPHTGASFSTVGGVLRVRYKGARSEHGLGYRLAYTRYLFIDNAPD